VFTISENAMTDIRPLFNGIKTETRIDNGTNKLLTSFKRCTVSFNRTLTDSHVNRAMASF
jgi:hypothetical protein